MGVDQYASYYVETPDPNFECPALGQHLIIDWVVPDHFADMPDLNVFVKVRFYNGSEQILTIPLHTLKGTYYWVIVRDEYDTTGGIATFQAFLRSGSFDLYEWKHQLWNETIQLNIE